MRLPKHNEVIDIIGHKLVVKYKKHPKFRGQTVDGFFKPKSHLIILKKPNHIDFIERTFIHELIHAMFWALEWDYDNERQIESFEKVLYQTLKTNKLW